MKDYNYFAQLNGSIISTQYPSTVTSNGTDFLLQWTEITWERKLRKRCLPTMEFQNNRTIIGWRNNITLFEFFLLMLQNSHMLSLSYANMHSAPYKGVIQGWAWNRSFSLTFLANLSWSGKRGTVIIHIVRNPKFAIKSNGRGRNCCLQMLCSQILPRSRSMKKSNIWLNAVLCACYNVCPSPKPWKFYILPTCTCFFLFFFQWNCR